MNRSTLDNRWEYRFSLGLLRALGELGADAQAWFMREYREIEDRSSGLPRIVRPADVAQLLQLANALDIRTHSDPRAALALACRGGYLGRRVEHVSKQRGFPLYDPHSTEGRGNQLAALLAPRYADARIGLKPAIRLALGDTPVDLAAYQLTPLEADQWLLDGAPGEIATWYVERYAPPNSMALRYPYLGDVTVAKWLIHLLADPAERIVASGPRLGRTREVELASGRVVRFDIASELTQLRSVDLPQGIATTVQAAAENYARRIERDIVRSIVSVFAQRPMAEIVTKPEWWDR